MRRHKQNMSKNLITILTLTLITLVVIVITVLVETTFKSTIPQATQDQITPVNPNIDVNLLQELEKAPK